MPIEPLPPPGQAPGASWAHVHARDQIVRYRRAGAGEIVLLLGASEGNAPWAGLEAALATRARVVVPELSGPAMASGDASLAAFLECLGASRVAAIVLHPPLVVPVLSLALRDPDLISRVAIVAGEFEPRDGILASLNSDVRAAVPMLVLARTLPENEARTALVDFVCAAPDPRSI